jgi:hypothetical protein
MAPRRRAHVVMPGLVPGIHVAVQSRVESLQAMLMLPDVDGRDKPGHDGARAALRLTA